MASFSLHGIPVSRGIAVGRAHLLTPAALDVKHYLVGQTQVEAEVRRLQNAFAVVHQELRTIWEDLPADAPPELGAFIDIHILILSDPLLAEAPLDIIRSRHYNAEWALVTQIDQLSSQFDEIEDPYLRARKADIQQVAERVLKVLTGTAQLLPATSDVDESHASLIVVAHDISPADMLQFRNRAFAGIATDAGGQNSHTTLVARSLDIPAAVGLSNASLLIKQDDWLIIDGDSGVVMVNPSPLILHQYREMQAKAQRERKKLSKLKKTPAVTLDGTAVTLLANIELPEDCAAAMEAGANGIGLFRSEFLFMGHSGYASKLPSEEEQFDAYRRAVLTMKGRPVTIRTLDIGADKRLKGFDQTATNPALGLRAIRYCMAEPQLFLTQLRAILRASAFGPVKLLIPMLSHSFEISQTMAMINQAKAQLLKAGQKFDAEIKIGAMIEVPAAALMLPTFVRHMDFLSIGTNDLIQYTLAIDRSDHEVAHLYDPTHPAVLLLLAMTAAAAAKAGIPVSICGGMAGDAKLTRLLLGMGFRELSMPAAQLLPVKQEVLGCDLERITPLVRKILRSDDPAAIRQMIGQLAEVPAAV
ncbi:phosphoenolpyruvate--protein phosphotransferase [Herminiimonas sp. CN]|uniref:phosphoenolpyruvate--protein phosphotransferase n=1 Tax=Herminiimonas sp. CN TaxID=1349818 RepID=UPI000473E0E6|nr:phosphoenolpyruvate--protein phosphotransferase [Herminiimonas sp. CN]